MMGCYIYCITRGKLENYQDKGVNDEIVYPIYAQELTALVHDCQAEPYIGTDEQARKWILQHNQVIEKIQKTKNEVIPMSFDVIIKEDQGISAPANVQKWLTNNRAEILTRLDELQGKAEYKITLYLDDEVIKENYSQDTLTQSGEISGIEYLKRKKEMRELKTDYNRIINQQIKEYLQIISNLVSDLFINKNKKTNQKKKMILNLSVCATDKEAKSLGIFLEEINKNNIIQVNYSGPWPCYSFVRNIFPENKEQFNTAPQ